MKAKGAMRVLRVLLVAAVLSSVLLGLLPSLALAQKLGEDDKPLVETSSNSDDMGGSGSTQSGKLEDLVGQALEIVAAIASVYFALGLLSAALQGQYAAMTERPGVKAEVMQKVGLLLMCFAVIAFADGVGVRAQQVFGGIRRDPGAARTAILEFGNYVAAILIWLVVILMAFGVVFGFVDTQLNATIGQPVGIGTALQRVVGVVVVGVGGLLSMAFARLVVNALGSF